MTVDIVVPVYNAPVDVARCVEAVLACTTGDYRLLLIDDASTDPAIGPLLQSIESRRMAHVQVLRNERNLGFIGTCNRGMSLSSNDVVLLNSDAIPTSGWLDALRRCAASDPLIGTVTPFSNNAEIASFPRFCVDNPAPVDAEAEAVARALRRTAVPTYPDIPTGVGFCLYLRRALLDAVGLFDPVFGAGYGEENDLCLRAVRAGWRNVLADDAYVRHTGGRSFAGRKAELGRHNLQILVGRHPHYERMVHAYIAADPLAPLRQAASMQLAQDTPTRGVLHVLHDHGGGTETHARALIAALRHHWRHCLAIAVGDDWQVEEHRADGTVVTYAFTRGQDEPWEAFLRGLCATFGIALMHLHNLSRCREGLLEAVPRLGLPYGYTVHDLNFACPTITFAAPDGMYCGAETDVERCNACLHAQPDFRAIDVADWRARHAALAAHAAFLVAPSRWAADTFARYFPGAAPHVVPHADRKPEARSTGTRTAVLLPGDDVPTVAVLGAVGPDKGARRIERLAKLAGERKAPVRFVVIGYLDVQHAPWQGSDARLTVHGRYLPGDLADLLAHYRVALVLFPSAGPETFSYTLSETWNAGRAALVPPFGALAERVGTTGAGFVMSQDEWRDEAAMLDRILALLAPSGRAAMDAARTAARGIEPRPVEDMAGRTSALYEAALAGSPRNAALSNGQRFGNGRVRDALGYRAWTPPSLPDVQPVAAGAPVVPQREASGPFMTRLARRALAVRHTPVGRTLYRIAPRPWVNALKNRLIT
jgi:GT2 family glycosyltransferase/glycosyltransferase involved in cell wall biosynthesis